MSSRRDLTVDGSTLAVSSRAEADEDPALDALELKRRVERREAEVKRKDREIALLQREIQKLTKENKKYAEDSENLNRSLSNSRMLNQSMLDDAVHNQLQQQVAELQKALTVSEKSTHALRGEIEALRSTNNVLEAGLEDNVSATDAHQASHSATAAQLREVQTKVRFLQKLVTDKDGQIQNLEDSLSEAKESERRFKGMVEHQQIILAANENAMRDQVHEIRELRSSMQVRNETNHVLRNQVDNLNESTFTLTKKELDHLRKMERDHKALQERNQDLVRSVELHMELLQRAETEAATLRSQFEESKTQLNEMTEKANSRYVSEQDIATLKFLKKEVIKLRKENKEIQEALDEAKEELQSMHASKGFRSGMSTGGAPVSASGRAEVNVEQSRQTRIAAEETARALRNRMSFLLEQLEQASQLAASWQQQKAILKAEIGSLLRANHSLREKLISMQRNVLQTLSSRNEGPADKYSSHRAFLTDPGEDKDFAQETSNRLMDDLVALEAASDAVIQSGGTQTQILPDSVEAGVERALFDTICAFSAGLRGEESNQLTKANPRTKRKILRVKGSYKLFSTPDGRVDIAVEGGDVDAGELLMNLHLPAFLKFVQSRPPDKIAKMFTEKLIAILNYVREMLQDYLEQLGDARMQLGKLQSRASVSLERASKVRERCSRERLSKQKAVMRYIKEQLRISDIRLSMSEVSERAANYLDIYIQRERAGDANFRDKGIKDILAQVVQARRDLEAIASGTADGSASSSGPTSLAVGSLELRLASCELDDETLHAVVGLVCGVLAPTATASDPSPFSEPSDKIMGATVENRAEKQISAGAQLAKSILMSECDYTSRLISMDLRGNSLTDVSCKVLGAMIEKSNCLRLLDLRENIVSKAGAKLLFESTRRNITVLYVTQRQGGFMIEGHREILGSSAENEDRVEGAGAAHMTASQQEAGPKHSLRVDIRNNVCSDEALEGLLESVEFKSGVRYISAPENMPQDAPITLQSILSDPKNFNDMLMQRETDPSVRDRASYSNISLIRGHSAGTYATASTSQMLRSQDMRPSSQPIMMGSPSAIRKSASGDIALGNRIHARVSAARNYHPEDDDDEENILGTGLNDELQGMLLTRKDKDKGIIGVGGLLEQQIRKLQVQQPHAALHGGRSGGERNLSTSQNVKFDSKNNGWVSAPHTNTQEEMTRIYQAPMRELASMAKKSKAHAKVSISKGIKRRSGAIVTPGRGNAQSQPEPLSQAKATPDQSNKSSSMRPPLRPSSAVFPNSAANTSFGISGAGVRSSSPAALGAKRPSSAPSTQRQQTIRGFGSTAPAPAGADYGRSASPIHRLNLDPAVLF